MIMAAGKGTRLKSRRPKVLHEIGGKPLLMHVIAAARKMVAAADIFVVVGHEAERVEAAAGATGVRFVRQTEQLGTGHAIQCAREAIANYDSFLVLSGDAPLIRPETLELIWQFHEAEKAAMTLLSAVPENPFGYGRVFRRTADGAEVAAIVEQKLLRPDQLGLREINSGFYAFRTAPLLRHLGELKTNNPQGEYYLTDMAGILNNAGERVVAVAATDAQEILGANTIAELVSLDATLRMNNAARLMAQGVTIFRPETCVIDSEVEVGPDTVIEGNVQLLGKTRIGVDCFIRSGSVLESSHLADNVLVRQNCIVTEAVIGARA